MNTSVFGGDFFTGVATGQLFPEMSEPQVEVPVVSVRYYDRDRLIGEGVKPPSGHDWTLTWRQIPAGTHSITAVATDALGMVAMADLVTHHRRHDQLHRALVR